MQAMTVSRLMTPQAAGRSSRALRQQMLGAGAVRSNSFIKQVMEQVKKDMESDDKLKKDYESAMKSQERFKKRTDSLGDRMSDLGEDLKSVSAKTAERLSEWKESAAGSTSRLSNSFRETTEQSESMKKAKEFLDSHTGTAAEGSRAALNKAKDGYGFFMDKTSSAFSFFGDEHTKAEKLKRWKESRVEYEARMKEEAAVAEAAAAEEATLKAEGKEGAEAAEGSATSQTSGAKSEEHAMVVSDRGNSTWERFGAGLKDSPFLSSIFENPLFDRVFGESEIAASIREMKEIDYDFQLEEFAEEIEYVIAPHIIQTYLDGDQEALKKHCGEAAFAAVDASIKARKTQKLSLDTNILAGPREVTLVSAKLMDKGSPVFIWTFHMQQVNCLRDKAGEIIEGAVDDIRTVCYALAVMKHPELEKTDGLEYPWQVSELAILWNQPCF